MITPSLVTFGAGRTMRPHHVAAPSTGFRQGPKAEFVREDGGLEAAYLRATGAEPDHVAAPA